MPDGSPERKGWLGALVDRIGLGRLFEAPDDPFSPDHLGPTKPLLDALEAGRLICHGEAFWQEGHYVREQKLPNLLTDLDEYYGNGRVDRLAALKQICHNDPPQFRLEGGVLAIREGRTRLVAILLFRYDPSEFVVDVSVESRHERISLAEALRKYASSNSHSS